MLFEYIFIKFFFNLLIFLKFRNFINKYINKFKLIGNSPLQYGDHIRTIKLIFPDERIFITIWIFCKKITCIWDVPGNKKFFLKFMSTVTKKTLDPYLGIIRCLQNFENYLLIICMRKKIYQRHKQYKWFYEWSNLW
jgi:hypothetical protein